jgi:hypothetical protein
VCVGVYSNCDKITIGNTLIMIAKILNVLNHSILVGSATVAQSHSDID